MFRIFDRFYISGATHDDGAAGDGAARRRGCIETGAHYRFVCDEDAAPGAGPEPGVVEQPAGYNDFDMVVSLLITVFMRD